MKFSIKDLFSNYGQIHIFLRIWSRLRKKSLMGMLFLCSVSIYKVAAGACNFIKKEPLAQVFSCEFCKISKTTIFREHIWATTSEWY